MSKFMSLARAIAGALSGGQQDEKPAWRDTSLDDWRTERNREHQAEREARGAGRPPGDESIITGSDEKERSTERIGG